MAEGGQDMCNEEETESWWDKWIKTAKEKSSTTLEFIKKDLTEFSQTVQHDTASAISSTATFLKDQLRVDETAGAVASKAKEGLTTIWDTITDAFILPKELEDTEMCIIQNSEPVLLERWQAQLHAIQTDPRTYCHEPESPPEEYEAWLSTFSLESCENEQNDILNKHEEVQSLYEKLVPSAVSHSEFWQRYFYRVHQMKTRMTKEGNVSPSVIDRIPPLDISVANDGNASSKSDPSSSSLQEECCTKSVDELRAPSKAQLETSNYNLTLSTPRSTVEDNSLLQRKDERTIYSNEPTLRSGNAELHNSLNLSSGEVCKPKSTNDHFKCDSEKDEVELITKEKGDVVVVCPSRSSLTPESSDSNSKEESTEDDWEKDFELDVTDEERTKQSSLKSSGVDDEWESWE